MKLPYHNPLQQTVPDAMHTIKDVVENLFGLISGRRDNEKVREAERKLGRFTLLEYCLTKVQLKLADDRLLSVHVPAHIDYKPKCMYTKKVHMKSHDWKQVCYSLYFSSFILSFNISRYLLTRIFGW